MGSKQATGSDSLVLPFWSMVGQPVFMPAGPCGHPEGY